MKLSDFHYTLPQALIAQTPLKERSASRLLVIDRKQSTLAHKRFTDITQYLQEGDCLVCNDTKVSPARLYATKQSGGAVEILLLKLIDEARGVWQALLKPGSRVRAGMTLALDDGSSTVHVLDNATPGNGSIRQVRLETLRDPQDLLEAIGHMPLPPYIKREDNAADRERYQTLFAREPGAVAAPTAGLHFDETVLRTLTRHGVEIVCVTLHVGYGTFQPVVASDIRAHTMHAETYAVSPGAAARINQAKREGRRVIACGTTTVRALESAALEQKVTVTKGDSHFWEVQPGTRDTSLFIRSPYQFRVVNGLITNFHLPQSTLLMLVSAFAGTHLIRRAYAAAIAKQYRFYSYGDAMLIL